MFARGPSPVSSIRSLRTLGALPLGQGRFPLGNSEGELCIAPVMTVPLRTLEEDERCNGLPPCVHGSHPLQEDEAERKGKRKEKGGAGRLLDTIAC